MSKLVIIKTRVRETMHSEVERIAHRDDQSIADVLRRFIREGLERDARKNGKAT